MCYLRGVTFYLAEGALAQHFEQLKLASVGLLRTFLDHVGDVNLLDDVILLERDKRGRMSIIQETPHYPWYRSIVGGGNLSKLDYNLHNAKKTFETACSSD